MKRLFHIALLLALPFGAQAQATADDFFHQASQHYIATQTEPALAAVNEGLRLAPNDPKLQALKQAIEEMQQQQQQQQDQQQQDQEQQDQEQQEQQDQQQQDQQQDQQNQDEQQQDQQNQDPQQQDQQQQGDQQEQQQPEEQEAQPDPNQLSEEQAERMLQALENDEEQLLRQVQKMKTRPRRVEKDW